RRGFLLPPHKPTACRVTVTANQTTNQRHEPCDAASATATLNFLGVGSTPPLLRLRILLWERSVRFVGGQQISDFGQPPPCLRHLPDTGLPHLADGLQIRGRAQVVGAKLFGGGLGEELPVRVVACLGSLDLLP